jgi:putative DNA primase/helicase
MHKELPGLLNWVMAMSEDEVKAVIGGINGQMTQTQREHLVETNKIAAWLDDNIVVNPDSITYVGSSIKGKDHNEISLAKREKLYANYEAWCLDGAVHPVALQRFTANVVDVCDQLKIDVTALNKDKHGKPIKGIAIRGSQHSSYATPVTKKLIGDPEKHIGDPVVTRQSRASSHSGSDYPINSLITITTGLNEEPEFI